MPSILTFGDVKDSGVAARINMCATDPRFAQAVNRVVRWLLLHGSWIGTTQRAQFCVDESCITMPGCVASLDAVFNGCRAVDIKSQWYQFIPYSPAPVGCDSTQVFEPFGTIPTARTMPNGGIIRSFAGSTLDYGKKITWLGYDINRVWVRTPSPSEAGVLQDGETVTLGSPWIDTTTVFGSVTGVLKDPTEERVTCFSHDPWNSLLTPLATYEYWETRPNYQRYKLLQYRERPTCDCDGTSIANGCTRSVVDAMVKLEFIPVKKDSDYLLISNLPALELALEALKAKDDGDLQKCDVLLYGTKNNTRLGALPMLQQELRTYTSDRFMGRVNIFGTAPLRRKFAGFI